MYDIPEKNTAYCLAHIIFCLHVYISIVLNFSGVQMAHYYFKHSVALNFGIMCTMCTGTVNIAAINSTCTTAMFWTAKIKMATNEYGMFQAQSAFIGLVWYMQ